MTVSTHKSVHPCFSLFRISPLFAGFLTFIFSTHNFEKSISVSFFSSSYTSAATASLTSATLTTTTAILSHRSMFSLNVRIFNVIFHASMASMFAYCLLQVECFSCFLMFVNMIPLCSSSYSRYLCFFLFPHSCSTDITPVFTQCCTHKHKSEKE